MPSQILPITNRNSSQPTSATMLLKADIDIDDPTTSLLISSSLEDETCMPIKPLLSRTSSYNSTTTTAANIGTTSSYYQQRRRRIASDSSLSSLSSNGRSQSFGRDVGHVAAETFLLTRLSLKLLKYLGVGYRWITRFLALGCYAFLLMPGFIQVGYYYFFSSQVRRSIVYGDKPRNRLDLYLPKNSDGPKPVVAFVTGGAWIIGYKAWGSLLGQQLSERDIIVACIDYRNFPQGTINDMVKDASQGVSFVCNNIAEYGGDPDRVYLMGQSAGAHIAACTLLEQAIKEAGEGESTTWSVSQIKAYFGLSGGYNLFNLIDHFHSRGLYRSIFLSIMEGEQSLRRFSPEVMVQEPNIRNAVSLLPPIFLFHGTADYSIPADASKDFADTLVRVGVKAESILYEGKTHTDLFLQDPMRGGRDELFENLVAIIHAGDTEALAKDVVAPPRRRLVPEFMLKLARSVWGDVQLWWLLVWLRNRDWKHRVGYRWITRFLALGCYFFLLVPGFIQVGYYYFFSSQVRRSIVYGDKPRNRLDLYLPKNSDGPKPVVALVTGGAWIIGYKAWGSLLGQQLSERDIIVACIDYRNFPQGTINDMVKDASQGVSFVCNNIAEYGGDPDRVYLMGQSAGAHIAACTLLEQAIKEAGEGESTTWSVSQIKAYFGLSGGYNLFNLIDHFHSRGLYRSLFLSIMEGEQSLRRFSPEVMVQEPNIRNAVSLLPPFFLFHGTADYSIPADASKDFADTLGRVGVKAESILYEGKTHTDLFVQDPMRGGRDELFENLVAIIHAGDTEALAKDLVAPPRRRLVPEFMLKLARSVSPF